MLLPTLRTRASRSLIVVSQRSQFVSPAERLRGNGIVSTRNAYVATQSTLAHLAPELSGPSALSSPTKAAATQSIPTIRWDSSSSLSVTLPSAPFDYITLPNVWLRDTCQCPTCIHPTTRQKTNRTSDVPLDIGVVRAEWIKAQSVSDLGEPEGYGDATNEGWILEVEWDKPIYRHDTTSSGIEGHAISRGANHVSRYSAAILGRLASPKATEAFYQADVLQMRPWLREDLLRPHHSNADNHAERPSTLFIPYSDLLSSKATLLHALKQLTQYGFVVFIGVPTTVPFAGSGDDWELRRVANFISHVRATFYGALWDVKKVGESKNVAYTDLDLDLHMDLLYLSSPPRYQLLHCLRNRNVIGGRSLFVDGIYAAQTLYNEDRKAFEALRDTDVRFHYHNDGHHLTKIHRTFVVDPNSNTSMPNITAINYSPPFQAPLSLQTTPPEFYPALQKFAALLRRPEARYEFLMQEGDVVCFDNRRVLHARGAFTDSPESVRWLKGAYVEADDIVDKVRVLEGMSKRGLI
ncbi:hypothetical protein FRB98_007522 [Tulasnella sp. 332]|nr:hypothetical protein FRB98_007522 [Tulasnella sp. 332]